MGEAVGEVGEAVVGTEVVVKARLFVGEAVGEEVGEVTTMLDGVIADCRFCS